MQRKERVYFCCFLNVMFFNVSQVLIKSDSVEEKRLEVQNLYSFFLPLQMILNWPAKRQSYNKFLTKIPKMDLRLDYQTYKTENKLKLHLKKVNYFLAAIGLYPFKSSAELT